MKPKHALLYTGIMTFLLPGIATAEQPSYSYIQAGYAEMELDDTDLEPSGYFLNGSYELNEHWFVHGGYIDVDESSGSIDVEANEFYAGVGYQHPLGKNSSIHLALAYIEVEAEAENNLLNLSADEDDDAIGVSLGLRSNITSHIELNADINYADFDVSDGDEVSLGIGLVWHVVNNVGLVLEAEGDKDDNRVYQLGIRMTF